MRSTLQLELCTYSSIQPSLNGENRCSESVFIDINGALELEDAERVLLALNSKSSVGTRGPVPLYKSQVNLTVELESRGGG